MSKLNIPDEVFTYLYFNLPKDTLAWASTYGVRFQIDSILGSKWLFRGELTDFAYSECGDFLLGKNFEKLFTQHPGVLDPKIWEKTRQNGAMRYNSFDGSAKLRFALYKSFSRYSVDQFRKWCKHHKIHEQIREALPGEVMTPTFDYSKIVDFQKSLSSEFDQALVAWRVGLCTRGDIMREFKISRSTVERRWYSLHQELFNYASSMP